ncbi:hypothetical protein [Roseibacillus persicicus]|uniref:hypothetical protein n=1 Tax=Roseibacillus persicicus TaxID=454148 RepID=UPI0028103380|nr:hypothetical protein [Roseibacillus persicicus]MDQ8189479.1 hypothetical protein [Roseibacillus persicicus]
MTSKTDLSDPPEDSLYSEASAPISTDSNESQEASSVEIISNEDLSKGKDTGGNLKQNTRRSWLPWKRQNRRDQQLSQLREGYIELIELIRSISSHLEWQKQENSQVSALVESLPPALNSFEKLATSQQQVTAILGRINSHMEDSNLKDQKLLENMQGFNSTIKEVSATNHNALGTLNQVQDRIGQSDERMTALFQQASQTNEVVGDMMMRLEKRLFLSNITLIVLLVLLMGLGIFFATRGPAREVRYVHSPESVMEESGPGQESQIMKREDDARETAPPVQDPVAQEGSASSSTESESVIEEIELFPGLVSPGAEGQSPVPDADEIDEELPPLEIPIQ